MSCCRRLAAVLAGVDLDFQLQPGFRLSLGRKPEDQMRGMPRLFPVALAQPAECIPDGIDGVTDGLRPNLDQIDVLGIAQRTIKQQLVDGGAAPEGDRPGVTDRRNGARDVRRNGARIRWTEQASRGG